MQGYESDDRTELENALAVQESNADRAALKLFHAAVKSGRYLLALELAAGMNLQRSLEGSLTLANARKCVQHLGFQAFKLRPNILLTLPKDRSVGLSLMTNFRRSSIYLHPIKAAMKNASAICHLISNIIKYWHYFYRLLVLLLIHSKY